MDLLVPLQLRVHGEELQACSDLPHHGEFKTACGFRRLTRVGSEFGADNLGMGYYFG